MKRLILLSLSAFAIAATQAQQTVSIRETQQQLTKSSTGMSLPFIGTKALLSGQEDKNIHRHTNPFSQKQTQGLNIFVWEDLQCTRNQRFKQLATWLILDQPVPGNYRLKDIEIYAAGILKRHLLAIYSPGGELIDQMESAIFGESAKEGLPLWIKQFRVDVDMTVTIYQLKADKTVPLNFWDSFQSLRAQRIDTKYKIDDTGRFRKISEISYQPQTYTINQLTDQSRNIWDGGESVVN